MPFISIAFAGFFAIVALVHFALPARWRWAWLLAASLYFCGWASPAFMLQLLAATGVAYVAGLLMDGARDKPRKQVIMGWAILALVANLFVFKYASFFNESVRSVLGWVGVTYSAPEIELPLPLGISFYTFLLIGYLVDLFRGAKAERDFGVFALFAAFFPKLVSGPIERGKSFLPQLHAPPAFDVMQAVFGLQLILWGVFKKAVVADRIAPFVDDVYSDPHAWDGVAYSIATFMYAFQVYCDFSGYTDIAIGAAAILGLKLMNNFNRPYFATSIQDFWKRWHISLTSWLTDYIYTPLTRQKTFKIKFFTMMLIGLFITFVASGLWHGADWTFVIWGALHGGFIVASLMLQKPWNQFAKRIGLDKRKTFYRGLKIAVTFTLVCAAYVWFRAGSVADAAHITTHLLTGWGDAWTSTKALFGARLTEFVLAFAGIGVIVAADVMWGRGWDAKRIAALRPVWAKWGLYYVGTVSVMVLGAFYGGAQKFIYFQF